MIDVPKNSLTVATADNLAVARFFNVSPLEIENEWTYLDFLDRYEYMMIQNYIDAQAADIE